MDQDSLSNVPFNISSMEGLHRTVYDAARALAEKVTANRYNEDYISKLDPYVREFIKRSGHDDDTLKGALIARFLYLMYIELDEETIERAKRLNTIKRDDVMSWIAQSCVEFFFDIMMDTCGVESKVAYAVALHEACIYLQYAGDEQRSIIRERFAAQCNSIYQKTSEKAKGEIARWIALVMGN